MNEEKNTPELNGTSLDATSQPPSDMTLENASESPPEAKKGPPVAPKPTWFRQSLRKIRDEQDQKKQDKPVEQRTPVGFSKSFGVRSASSGASLSIKQKIYSFETFSSPGGPVRGGNRGPVANFSSIPVMKNEPKHHPPSRGDYGKGKDELPKEVHNQSVGETDSTTATAAPSASTSSCSETQPTAKSSEDEPPPSQCPKDLPPSDPICIDPDSGTHDSHTAPVHDDESALLSQQDLESTVLPSTASVAFSQANTMSPPEEKEGDKAQTVSAAASTDSHPHRVLEGESLGKILTFSNQVCPVRN